MNFNYEKHIIKLIIFAWLIISIVTFLLRSILIVQTNQVVVVEIFGQYFKTIESGLSFLYPWHTIASRVDLKETYIFIKPQNIITKDNVNIDIDGVLLGSCFNPYLFVYKVEKPFIAIEGIVHTKLRAICGQMSLLEILISRNVINEKLLGELNATFHQWGFNVSFVEIKDINAPKNIKEIMSRQLEADMERKRIMLINEGDFQVIIRKAEAEKESAILNSQALLYAAETEAKIINEIITVLNSSPDHSVRNLLVMNYIKAIKSVKEGSQNNFVLSMDIQKIVDQFFKDNSK